MAGRCESVWASTEKNISNFRMIPKCNEKHGNISIKDDRTWCLLFQQIPLEDQSGHCTLLHSVGQSCFIIKSVNTVFQHFTQQPRSTARGRRQMLKPVTSDPQPLLQEQGGCRLQGAQRICSAAGELWAEKQPPAAQASPGNSSF